MSAIAGNRWASYVASAIAGVSLSGGDGVAAGLAGIIVWYAVYHQYLVARRQADDDLIRALKAHNDQLVTQDFIRQQEYERLVELAQSKIGQANMVISGTRR